MSLLSPARFSLRPLAIVILTVSLSALGLAMMAAICWFSVPPVAHSAAFTAQFTVYPGFLYSKQPAKSIAFEVCCLAAPGLLVLTGHASRKLMAPLSPASLRRCVGWGLAAHLLFWGACLVPVFYCPHPALWITPRWLLVPLRFPPAVPAWEWLVSLLAGALLALFFLSRPAAGRTRNGVMVPVLLLWFLLAPTRFYAPSEIGDQLPFTYHLNSVLDAFSQATNGHHLLVDFPHIYGGYVEILAPLLRLFPRTIGVPLLALAIPSVLSVLFLLLAARLIVRPPGVLLLCCLGILSFSFLVSLPDPNYGYATARSFFPALGLLLAALYFKRPGPGGYVLTSLVAALAPVWNMDTGLVLWASWLITLGAMAWSAKRTAKLAHHVVIQLALFFAAGAAFFLYLRLVSGSWPDPHLLFYFQSLVVKSGYFCVPLLVPNAWLALALLYLVGLAVAIIGHGQRRVRWETQMILLTTLLGIGEFSYYMGRSAETNLISVCTPAVLLLGLLLGQSQKLIRIRCLPVLTRWFFLPWVAMIFWWIILLFAQLPVLLGRGPQLVRDGRETSVSPFEADADLVSQWVRPHEKGVYFLSNHSGLYYYLTQTARPLRIPGTIELLKTCDMDVLLAAIRNRQVVKLVVEQNFYAMEMYRSDVYQAIAASIAQNYRPLASSPSGGLTLYLPRQGP